MKTIEVTPATGYKVLVVFYDNDNTYTKLTPWSVDTQTIIIDDNEKYIRICLMKEPESNLPPSNEINVSIMATYKISYDIYNFADALNTMSPIMLDNNLVWSIGGIGDGGVNTNNTIRIRTDFFNISNYSALDIICQTGYKFSIAFYNESKTWLFSTPISGFITGQRHILLSNEIKYMRICVSSTDDSTVSDTAMSSQISCFAYNMLVGKVKTNQIELSSGITWVRGTLDENGNYVTSTSRVVTEDYVALAKFQSIKIIPLVDTVKYNIIWYGSNGKIGSTNLSYSEMTFTVPANVTKAKLVLIAEPDVWMGNANISNSIKIYGGQLSTEIDGNISIRDYFVSTCVNKKEIPVFEAGTTIITVGDSITAASDNTGWVYHIKDMTQVSIINKAIGGSTFGESVSDQSHRISNQINNITTDEWSIASLIIIAAGTNDYQHETPLEELKEKVQEIITTIRSKTNIPIVFITPIRRGLSKNNDIMQKISMISGIICNVAVTNQCNVICGYDFPIATYSINGLIDNMTRDALHPTAVGANTYARAVLNALQ